MEQKLEPLHFFALPPEIIIYVLQYISPENLCSVLLLNRDFYDDYAEIIWGIKLRQHFPAFKTDVIYPSSFQKFLAAYQEVYKDQDKTARKCFTLVKENDSEGLEQTLNLAFPSGYKIGALPFLCKVLTYAAQYKQQSIFDFVYEKYMTDEPAIGYLSDGSAYLLEPLKKYSLGSALESALICQQPQKRIAWFLDQGCDVNEKPDYFLSPLMRAVAQGRLDTVKLFIEKEAQINVQTSYGATALVIAVTLKHWDIMRFLVEKGADINPVCPATPLMIAILKKDWEIMQFLVTHGANVRPNDIYNPLITVIVKKNWDAMRFLVEHGAPIDIPDENGYTPLMVAIFRNHFASVQYLVARGANIDLTDKKNKTALMHAAEDDYWDIVQLLLEKGATINPQSSFAKRLLVRATVANSLAIIKILVQQGVDVDTNELNSRPLQIALCQNHWEIIKFLVENGASISLPMTTDGVTPLMYAAARNRLEIVKFLVQKGAPLNTRDRFFSKAFSYAKEAGHLEVILFLVEEGAEIHDYEILQLFDNIISSNNVEFLKRFIAFKKDINLETLEGLLNKAIYYRKINIIELILQRIQEFQDVEFQYAFQKLFSLWQKVISNVSPDQTDRDKFIYEIIEAINYLITEIFIPIKNKKTLDLFLAEMAMNHFYSTLLNLATNEKCLIAGMVVLALLSGLLAGLALGLTFSVACDLDVLQIPAIFESFFTSGSLTSLSAGAIAGMSISACAGGVTSAVTAGYLTRYGIFRHDPLRSAAYDVVKSVEKVVKNSSESGICFNLRAA